MSGKTRKALTSALTFFAAFFVVGVVMDQVLDGGPVQWGYRATIAAIAAGVFGVAKLFMSDDKDAS